MTTGSAASIYKEAEVYDKVVTAVLMATKRKKWKFYFVYLEHCFSPPKQTLFKSEFKIGCVD